MTVPLVTASLMPVSLLQVAMLCSPHSVIARRPQADVAIHCPLFAAAVTTEAIEHS